MANWSYEIDQEARLQRILQELPTDEEPEMPIPMVKVTERKSNLKAERVEIAFDDDNPRCPHGPTFLLEKHTLKGIKRYYGCSAHRNKKLCRFYYPVDKDFASIVEYLKDQEALEKPPHTHEEYMKRLNLFLTYPIENRSFCQTCSQLLLLEEKSHHKKKCHSIINDVDLKKQPPTLLLHPQMENKAFAQYHFSENTVNFLTEQLKTLGFSRVICIGCPRIHENISSHHSSEMETLLLDMDYRYMQFNTDKHFCRYNLFNHWFFNNIDAEEVFRNFLCKQNGDRVVIVLDPPFGGLIDAISRTLNKICKLWHDACRKNGDELPIVWCFPYFNEKRIVKNHKSMQMLDFQVEYENQKHYKRGTCGSPVRIFTNLKPSSFDLLKKFGFRFCNKCQKYVSKQNQHCIWCNSCTSKNGAAYVHCKACGICVKATYKHCSSCNRCCIPVHNCKNLDESVSNCLHPDTTASNKKFTHNSRKKRKIK